MKQRRPCHEPDPRPQTAQIIVEADTYQIAVEPGTTITAARTTSRETVQGLDLPTRRWATLTVRFAPGHDPVSRRKP